MLAGPGTCRTGSRARRRSPSGRRPTGPSGPGRRRRPPRSTGRPRRPGCRPTTWAPVRASIASIVFSAAAIVSGAKMPAVVVDAPRRRPGPGRAARRSTAPAPCAARSRTGGRRRATQDAPSRSGRARRGAALSRSQDAMSVGCRARRSRRGRCRQDVATAKSGSAIERRPGRAAGRIDRRSRGAARRRASRRRRHRGPQARVRARGRPAGGRAVVDGLGHDDDVGVADRRIVSARLSADRSAFGSNARRRGRTPPGPGSGPGSSDCGRATGAADRRRPGGAARRAARADGGGG